MAFNPKIVVASNAVILLCIGNTSPCFSASNPLTKQPDLRQMATIAYTVSSSRIPEPPLPATWNTKTLIKLGEPSRDGFTPYLNPSKIERGGNTIKVWLAGIKEAGAGRPNLLTQVEIDCSGKRVRQVVSQELVFSEEKSRYVTTGLKLSPNPKWNEQEYLVAYVSPICRYLKKAKNYK